MGQLLSSERSMKGERHGRHEVKAEGCHPAPSCPKNYAGQVGSLPTKVANNVGILVPVGGTSARKSFDPTKARRPTVVHLSTGFAAGLQHRQLMGILPLRSATRITIQRAAVWMASQSHSSTNARI